MKKHKIYMLYLTSLYAGILLNVNRKVCRR